MSERLEQIRIFDVLRLNHATDPRLKWVYASMNGLHSASPRMALDRQRQGQTAGISDICLPFPNSHFHGGYIELKAGRNKATVEQEHFINFLQEQGYFATVCHGADQALDVIENYCGGIRLRGRR